MDKYKPHILFLIISTLIIGLGLPAKAGTSEKTKDIAAMLKITGAAKLADQIGATILNQMMQDLDNRPNTPPQAIQIVKDAAIYEFKQSIPVLMKTLIPLYDRHFTHQEIKDVIAFYKTPTGQKVIRILPVIAQESMAIGELHSQIVVQKIAQRVKVQLKRAGFN